MPLYEFLCPECGTVFEVLRRFSQAHEPATCPVDGRLAVRVFNARAVLRSAFHDRRPVRVD